MGARMSQAAEAKQSAIISIAGVCPASVLARILQQIPPLRR